MNRRVTVALGALLVVLVARLVFGDDPWTGGIAERLADGDPVRSIDYARTWGWWMALVNAGVVAGLLVTRRRWLGDGPAAENPAFAAPPRADLRWFAPLVAGAVLATGVLAAPRLDDSLWGDELWTVYRAIDGQYRRGASGEIEFDQLRWRDTVYEYRKPSNHVGFTVLSRLSLAGWRTLARPELKFPSETALRLPAWLAGMAAVAALALLLRRMGMPGAGVLAAWVMALHPWVLRYASEARGYALLLVLGPLALWALWRALERGTWGRWALFGGAQFWMAWTWPSIVFHLALLNLAAAGSLGWVYRGRPELWGQALRWLFVTAAAGLLFLQLMLGGLFQLADYAARDWPVVRAKWLQQVGAHLLSGVHWKLGHPPYHDLLQVARAAPALFWPWVAVTVAAVAGGAVRLLRGGAVRALVVPVLLLPGPLLILYGWLEGAKLDEWSLLFTLPGAVLLLAAGIAGLPRSAAVPLAVGWLAAFAWIGEPARSGLRAGSLQPVRESVELTRPTLDPFAPENARILTASIHREPHFYDPNVVLVEEPRQLRKLMRRADREGLALWVNWGRPGLAEERVPELVAMLEEGDAFERVAVLYGFEPRGERRVHRYRGRGAAPAP